MKETDTQTLYIMYSILFKKSSLLLSFFCNIGIKSWLGKHQSTSCDPIIMHTPNYGFSSSRKLNLFILGSQDSNPKYVFWWNYVEFLYRLLGCNLTIAVGSWVSAILVLHKWDNYPHSFQCPFLSRATKTATSLDGCKCHKCCFPILFLIKDVVFVSFISLLCG